jgi:glycerol-3-phosphate acyltransferase PlsY
VLVMSLDILKGAASVWLAASLEGRTSAMAAAGAAAVVGHIYPVWLRFHGGKGVAVAAGVFSVLAPFATLVSAAVFLIVVWGSRVISLGSVAATVALPWVALLSGASSAVVVAAAGSGTLILFRHRANVRRILRGTERRMGLGGGTRVNAGHGERE